MIPRSADDAWHVWLAEATSVIGQWQQLHPGVVLGPVAAATLTRRVADALRRAHARGEQVLRSRSSS